MNSVTQSSTFRYRAIQNRHVFSYLIDSRIRESSKLIRKRLVFNHFKHVWLKLNWQVREIHVTWIDHETHPPSNSHLHEFLFHQKFVKKNDHDNLSEVIQWIIKLIMWNKAWEIKYRSLRDKTKQYFLIPYYLLWYSRRPKSDWLWRSIVF